MKPDRFSNVLGTLKEKGFVKASDVFSLVGLGEPLLYEGLYEAVKMVHELGNAVVLNTNALVLDRYWALLQDCLEPRDILVFSLNASNEQAYEKYMNSNKFDQVVESINKYLEHAGDSPSKQPHIYLRVLKVPENNPAEFRQLWNPKALQNPQVKISVHPLLHWQTEEPVRGHRYPCHSLWGSIVIDVEGNIYPCCKALSTRENSSLRIGHIDDLDLKEKYLEKSGQFRKEHLQQRYGKDCLYCDFWMETTWKWKIKSKLALIH
jgi:radical SAM protein with 4Fe4S-binding SPASM domain